MGVPLLHVGHTFIGDIPFCHQEPSKARTVLVEIMYTNFLGRGLLCLETMNSVFD